MKQAHRDAIGAVLAIEENGYVNEVWAGGAKFFFFATVSMISLTRMTGWDGTISVWRLSEPIMVPNSM